MLMLAFPQRQMESFSTLFGNSFLYHWKIFLKLSTVVVFQNISTQVSMTIINLVVKESNSVTQGEESIGACVCDALSASLCSMYLKVETQASKGLTLISDWNVQGQRLK